MKKALSKVGLRSTPPSRASSPPPTEAKEYAAAAQASMKKTPSRAHLRKPSTSTGTSSRPTSSVPASPPGNLRGGGDMRAAQESHLRPQRADGKGKFTEGDGKQPGVGRRPTTSNGDRPISAYPNGNGTAAPKLPAHLFPGLEPKPFPGAELRGDLKAAPGASGSHIRPNPSGSPLRAGAKSPTSSSGGRPLSVRPRSLSSGASSLGNQLGVIGQEWPARLSSNSTPWTSPATSWPAAGAVAPRDQVLKSAALVARILDLLDFPDPKYDERKRLKKQRRSLLHVALTCKSVSLPAIKVLWRRLDNILPLLRLLPSFGERGGKWGLFGGSHPYEWVSFDHHATYVREIVYEDLPANVTIDSAVFLRLFLRASSAAANSHSHAQFSPFSSAHGHSNEDPRRSNYTHDPAGHEGNMSGGVLPNLERFAVSAAVRPSESEVLVYMQSPALRVLELGVSAPSINPTTSGNAHGGGLGIGTVYGGDTKKMAATRDAVVAALSSSHPNSNPGSAFSSPGHSHSNSVSTGSHPSQHSQHHRTGLTHLLLIDQPFSLLAPATHLPLASLVSLEFRAMYGVMDATLLRAIGTLPRLRELTADSGCFTGLNLSNVAARLTNSSTNNTVFVGPGLSGGPPNANPNSNPNNPGGGGGGGKGEQGGPLFTHLTHLTLSRHPSLHQSTISLFLQLVASPRLRYLALTVSPPRKIASPKGGARDGRAPDAGELRVDPMYTIAQRWGGGVGGGEGYGGYNGLEELEMELDHTLPTLANFLKHIQGLRVLKLSGFVWVPPAPAVGADLLAALPPPPLVAKHNSVPGGTLLPLLTTSNLSAANFSSAGADLVAALAPLAHVHTLSLRLRTGAEPPQPIRLDVSALTKLVKVCPDMRSVEVGAVEAPVAPPGSGTWPVSGRLKKIAVRGWGRYVPPKQYGSAKGKEVNGVNGDAHAPVRAAPAPSPAVPTNAVALARYLDRLFPRLNSVRYLAPEATAAPTEEEQAEIEAQKEAWHTVQDLVFAFQDVRKGV